MPLRVLSEDWTDYDNKKITDRRDARYFSCEESWEVEYLTRKIKKFKKDKTDLEIRQAIAYCCRIIPGNKPREQFVKCVMGRLMLIVCFLLPYLVSFSQECKSPFLVTVDFANRQVNFPCKDNFKRGESLLVQIINYNPYLYKVSINNSDTSNVPPVQGQIFSWFLDPSNLSSIVSGLGTPVPESVIGGSDLKNAD